MILQIRDSVLLAGPFQLLLDLTDIYGGQLEPLKDAVDLGGILCPNHHIRQTVLGVLILQDTVQNAVLLGLPAEPLQVLVLYRKNPKLLSAFQHIGQTGLTLGFLLILQHRIEQDSQLLCAGAGDLRSYLHTVQGHPDDLVSCVCASIHLSYSPFVGFLPA